MDRFRVALAGTAVVLVAALLARVFSVERPPLAVPSSDRAQSAVPSAWSGPADVTADTAGSGLHGVVYDASGQPAAGAEVSALPATTRKDPCANPLRQSARTDGAGAFSIRTREPGDVVLMARRSAGEFALARVSTAGPHQLQFGLPAGIEGRVTDSGGRPVAGGRVTIHVRPGGYPLLAFETPVSLNTGSDGSFRSGPLPPHSTAVVEAQAPGYRPIRQGPYPLTPGAATSAVFTLELGEGLIGAVYDVDGRPLEGVTITGSQGASRPSEARTGPDGTFRLTAGFPRQIRLIARKDGFAQATQDVPYPFPSVTLSLAPVTTVVGKVQPARPDLFAVVTSKSVSWMAPVGRDGRFTINNVERGPVRLEIQGSDRISMTSTEIDLAHHQGEILVQLR